MILERTRTLLRLLLSLSLAVTLLIHNSSFPLCLTASPVALQDQPSIPSPSQSLDKEPGNPRSLPYEIQLPNPNQHDRLFQTLHGARILAESGAGYEAARVIAAIAQLPQHSPPVHQARQQLEMWQLTIEDVQNLSALEISQRISRRSPRQADQSERLHLYNLMDLELNDEAASFMAKRSRGMSWQELREKWQVPGIPAAGADVPSEGFSLTPKRAQGLIASLQEQRKQWRQLQFLWLSDRPSGEIAWQLWRRIHPEQPMGFHEPHEHRPPLEEIIERACHQVERLMQEDPQLAWQLADLFMAWSPQTRPMENLLTSRDWPVKRNKYEIQPPETIPSLGQASPDEDLVASDIFESPTVLEYALSLNEEALELLRHEPREYVPATFHFGDEVYPEVGVRLKGGAGSFRPFNGEAKIGLTIKFNQFVKKQRFHGLKRIVLNNAVQDASYMNELLGYSLFRKAGIPAPRVTHATLTINQEPYGLYVQPEAVTGDFLKTWFQDPDGNLYEGPGDVLNWEGLDLDTNQERNDRSDLRRLAQVVETADDQNPWTSLSKEVNPRMLARFVALEQLVGHWDGFTSLNNYRIYHEPETDQFTLIPHGADQLFRDVNHPIYHDQASILGRAILQTSSGKLIYDETTRQLLNQVWNEQELRQQIRNTYVKLLPFIQQGEGKGHNGYLEFEQQVSRLLQFVELRRPMVMAQLQQNDGNWRRPRRHTGLPSFLRRP